MFDKIYDICANTQTGCINYDKCKNEKSNCFDEDCIRVHWASGWGCRFGMPDGADDFIKDCDCDNPYACDQERCAAGCPGYRD